MFFVYLTAHIFFDDAFEQGPSDDEDDRVVNQFVKQKPTFGVHFQLNGSQKVANTEDPEFSHVESEDESLSDENVDFLEILRLRHSNLSR